MADDLVQRLRDQSGAASTAGLSLWCATMTEAADELARKDAKIAELRKDIERLMDPNIVAMSIRDGGLDMNLEGTACRLLAESFASDFQKGGGTNYIECRFTSQEVMPGEAIVVTVQRINGKTPSQCRAEAEAERDEQRQRAERAEARVREAPVGTLLLEMGEFVFSESAPEHEAAASRLIDSRVALVLLGTEEAK